MTEILIIIAYGVLSMFGGIWVGYSYHRSVTTGIAIQSIEKYVADKFPDPWAAYKKGVREGYEQGLRDGQEISDESS